MALTRSSRASLVQTTVRITKRTTTTKRVAKAKKLPKTTFEESVQHINIPADYALPSAFEAYHKPKFIEGVKHIISKDPSLYQVIVHSNFEAFKKDQVDPIKEIDVKNDSDVIHKIWLALIQSVVSQQISGSAARAIFARFRDCFKGEPNPKEVLTKSTEELRAIGLSGMKVNYVNHISSVFSDPEENLTKLSFYRDNSLTDIIAELVKLKGIGEWSAKMFAIFTLMEWDVFAHDDLGIAKGASRYLERRPDLVKSIKMSINEDEELKLWLKKKGKFEKAGSKRDWSPYHDVYLIYLSRTFQPYRSIFMLILWRLASTNIDVLEGEK